MEAEMVSGPFSNGVPAAFAATLSAVALEHPTDSVSQSKMALRKSESLFEWVPVITKTPPFWMYAFILPWEVSSHPIRVPSMSTMKRNEAAANRVSKSSWLYARMLSSTTKSEKS
jgi:hypothetical protein